ncbi:MAG: HEAT repeat domain-containing protein [Planctomycetaceae bacterium]|nr:HEAT repeat domain-containing protein [Planctomycetaceae bacterium]
MSTRRLTVSAAVMSVLTFTFVLTSWQPLAGQDAQPAAPAAEPATPPAAEPAAPPAAEPAAPAAAEPAVPPATQPASKPAVTPESIVPSGKIEGDKMAGDVDEAARKAMGDTQPATGEAPAAGAGEQAARDKAAATWNDFVHFARIGQTKAAQSYATALLDSGTDSRTIYLLSLDSSDTRQLLDRAEKLPEMKDVVTRLRAAIEEGYFKLRQDPAEIAKAINSLERSVQAYELGARRLIISGQYALPQIIQRLMDPKVPPLLRERLITVLPRLGKEAVLPMSEALQTDNPNLQEIFADTLGRIGYPAAAPRLRELYDRKNLLPKVKKTVESALLACSGKEALTKPLAEMFNDMAEKYYYQAESLRPDERVSTANVWYWTADLGLTYRPVPRQIFCDIYAMRMCRLALDHDPNLYPAASLWLASYLKREFDLPAGEKDPLLAAGEMPASFYLQSASARYQQAVLQRGLNDYYTPTVLAAINALVNTNGAKNMIKTPQGAQPLVEALNYPAREVRFLAAESLALARPTERFSGSQGVLPVLCEALRQVAQPRAMLVVNDQDARNALKDSIRAAGFEVFEEADAEKALAAARAAGGVDVFVTASIPDPMAVLGLLRREGRFATTPLVVAAESTENRRVLAERDKRVILIGHSPAKEVVAEAMAKAQEVAAGKPMTKAQAERWAIRAAKAINQLAVTNNKILEYVECQPALVTALAGPDPVQIAVAETLGNYSDAPSQRAIAVLAGSEKSSADVRVAAYGSTTVSVRRFGNQLTESQADQIVNTVVEPKNAAPIRMGASQLLGAIDLPSEKIKPLILSTDKMD